MEWPKSGHQAEIRLLSAGMVGMQFVTMRPWSIHCTTILRLKKEDSDPEAHSWSARKAHSTKLYSSGMLKASDLTAGQRGIFTTTEIDTRLSLVNGQSTKTSIWTSSKRLMEHAMTIWIQWKTGMLEISHFLREISMAKLPMKEKTCSSLFMATKPPKAECAICTFQKVAHTPMDGKTTKISCTLQTSRMKTKWPI